jgi:transcriptional regulator with XRE-family HTH domain
MPPTARSKRLGRLIKKNRLERGLTLRAAADQIGYDHSYLGRLEAGDYESPAPKLLKNIAKALGIPIEDLYALSGYEVPDRLPNFAPYLRAKYDLPDEAVERLDEYFLLLKDKYGVDAGGGESDGRRHT